MNSFQWSSFVALVIISPLLVVNLFFAAELLAGLAGSLETLSRPSAQAQNVRVLIPAHNEAAIIGETLDRLKPELSERMQVLVIADNCKDETAAIARSRNVDVVERNDEIRRGKGYALAFARDHLEAAPPHAVIIFDADCYSDRLSLAALANRSANLQRPVQAIYLFEADRSAPPVLQISNFAFLIKNLVRQRGLQRLAGRVHLTGTGMCLPWSQFAEANLATSSIVEDLQLGLELAARGYPPQLGNDSVIWSTHAGTKETLGQRSRWEGGFLGTMRSTVPVLLRQSLKTRSIGTLFAALDLMIPPLALLVMGNAAIAILFLSVAVMGLISIIPGMALILSGSIAALFLVLAWRQEGKEFLSSGALIRVPLYAAWKLPMYVGLIKRGSPAEWNRTARSQETTRTDA